jgi:hypothetical protein
MRSGLIFRASDHISNRFLLCRMLSASARKMHRDGVSMSQSINQSLVALDGGQEHSAPAETQVNNQASNVEALKTEENLAQAAQAES